MSFPVELEWDKIDCFVQDNSEDIPLIPYIHLAPTNAHPRIQLPRDSRSAVTSTHFIRRAHSPSSPPAREWRCGGDTAARRPTTRSLLKPRPTPPSPLHDSPSPPPSLLSSSSSRPSSHPSPSATPRASTTRSSPSTGVAVSSNPLPPTKKSSPNSKGYEMAKLLYSKITHLSTVCEGKRLTLEGRHNANMGWISQVRMSGNLLVLPRVVLEAFPGELLQKKKQWRKAIDLIVTECKDLGCDGIMLESWSRWSGYGVLHDPDMRSMVTSKLFRTY